MNNLSDLVINSLVKRLPNDVLKQLIKHAQAQVRKDNQYKIVININSENEQTRPLLEDGSLGYDLQYIKLFVKFVIGLLDKSKMISDVYIDPRKQISFLRNVIRDEIKPEHSRFLSNSMTCYKDVLNFFLNTIDQYDDLSDIYPYIVTLPISEIFNFGFNKKDSLLLHEYAHDFEIENNCQVDFLTCCIAKDYDYIVCYQEFDTLIMRHKIVENEFLNNFDSAVYQYKVYQIL